MFLPFHARDLGTDECDSTAEGGIGLICACLPALKKLVEFVIGKHRTEKQEDTPSDQGPIVCSEQRAPPELNPIPSSVSEGSG